MVEPAGGTQKVDFALDFTWIYIPGGKSKTLRIDFVTTLEIFDPT